MRIESTSLGLALLVCFSLGGCTGPEATDAEFGQPPGGTQPSEPAASSTTQVTSAATAARSISVAWQKVMDGDFRSVAVSPAGDLVAAGFTPNLEDAPDEIRAFDAYGMELFTLQLDDESPPDEFITYIPRALSVSLGASGGAVATQNGVVHRFSAIGIELWQAIVKWDVAFDDANVAMHPDGGVLASAEKRIARLDAGGNELWAFTAGQTVRDLAVKADGTECWAASEDNFVYKLDCATGALLGEADLGEELQTAYPVTGWK